MSKGGQELSKAENDALIALLHERVARWERERGKSRGGLRAVGMAMGYPKESAQSIISVTLKRGFVTALQALMIYDTLISVCRDEFLGRPHGRNAETEAVRERLRMDMDAASGAAPTTASARARSPGTSSRPRS